MGVFYDQPEIKEFVTLFRGSDLVFAETYIEGCEFTQKPKLTCINMNTFIDTLSYAKVSVKRLGKLIGVEKMEQPKFLGKIPINKSEKDYLEAYNMNDAKVSYSFLKFLFKVFEEYGASPKKTIGSTAMSLFKNRFLDDEYSIHEKDILLDIFKSYYGGRTEAFFRGNLKKGMTKKKFINYFDVNSLYPSVMRNEYPNPNFLKTSFDDEKKIDDYDGVSEVDIFCPYMKYPLLPFRNETKVIFPTGNIRKQFYTHVELRKAKELGYKILKIYKTYYYTEKCFPFRTYVDFLYGMRLKHQKEKSPLEAVDKILLNSLYGKTAQRFLNLDNWTPVPKDLSELDKFEKVEIRGDFMRVKENVEPSSFCIPIWASYVTAYGRLKLYDYIVKHKPYYVDTDSIMTDDEIKTSDKLGDVKLEMKIIDGVIVKPKFYALLNDKPITEDEPTKNQYVKLKGLGRRLLLDDFMNLLKNPKVKYTKFVKFKEALIRHLIPNEIIDIEKNFSLNDDKRVWKNKDFNPEILEDSEPINLI